MIALLIRLESDLFLDSRQLTEDRVDNPGWELTQFRFNSLKPLVTSSLPFLDAGKPLIAPSLPFIGSQLQRQSLLIVA